MVNVKNDLGETPLHNIMSNWSLKTKLKSIKILLDNGSDINAKNENGKTPFELDGFNEVTEELKLKKDFSIYDLKNAIDLYKK